MQTEKLSNIRELIGLTAFHDDWEALEKLLNPDTDIDKEYFLPFQNELNINLIEKYTEQERKELINYYLTNFKGLNVLYINSTPILDEEILTEISQNSTVFFKETGQTHEVDRFDFYVIESWRLFKEIMNTIQVNCANYDIDFYEACHEVGLSTDFIDCRHTNAMNLERGTASKKIMQTKIEAALGAGYIDIKEVTIDKDKSKDHLVIKEIQKIHGFPFFLFQLEFNVSFYAEVELSKEHNFPDYYFKYYSKKWEAFNNKRLLFDDTNEIEFVKRLQIEEQIEFEKLNPYVSLIAKGNEVSFMKVCKEFLEYLEATRADLSISQMESEMKEMKKPITERIDYFKQQILTIDASPNSNTSGGKILIKRYQNAIDSLSVNIDHTQTEPHTSQMDVKQIPIKYGANEYAITYIFDLWANNQQVPTNRIDGGLNAKQIKLDSSKFPTYELAPDTFYRAVKDVLKKFDLNKHIDLLSISKDWYNAVKVLSNNWVLTEQYLKDKNMSME